MAANAVAMARSDMDLAAWRIAVTPERRLQPRQRQGQQTAALRRVSVVADHVLADAAAEAAARRSQDARSAVSCAASELTLMLWPLTDALGRVLEPPPPRIQARLEDRRPAMSSGRSGRSATRLASSCALGPEHVERWWSAI
eukprot:TRINITY_DN30027_c0_g1_i1.p3 TRINITY_DN30027_c0_g1~~TRINITY_DN30027_c0_g1_i1.p3  ORF type:complete len:142 (-),score=26.63 TRINITY_DN30027_c0_g1_i1:432-857(-)